MTFSLCEEELFSSIASLSPPLFLKSGTLELPHTSVPLHLEIIPSSEPTLTDFQPSSSTHTSTVHNQHISSTFKTLLLLSYSSS